MGRAPKTATVIDNEPQQEAGDGGFQRATPAKLPATQKPKATAMVSGMTPMDMVSFAVQNMQGVEVIEKLMELQERHDHNQARKNYDAALSMAQNGLPVIQKNREVDFTSQKGRTRYNYEDLAEITKAVRPVLAEHGLSFRFRTEQSEPGQVTVICRIAHEDGYFEENSLTAALDTSGNKNHIQSIASTVTFLERYTLKAALGLASSDDAEDDDGRGATQQQVPSAQQQQPKAEQTSTISSGPAKPFAITVPKGGTAEQWCELYVGFVQKARSVAEIEQWDAVNDQTLERLQKGYPHVFKIIEAAVKGCVDALSPKKAATATEPAKAAPKREPMQSDPFPALPDPNDEEKYEAFVEEATKALNEWKDIETLDAFWNERIESAPLLTPDRDDLTSAKRAAEKRLES